MGTGMRQVVFFVCPLWLGGGKQVTHCVLEGSFRGGRGGDWKSFGFCRYLHRFLLTSAVVGVTLSATPWQPTPTR